ncbi:uncharacterized protein LOC112559819 [Pomacea canaliculata]|uniref:uncharacterized protein LOC112559819 n=1 Tax=Pomacea canaliculata TaxID=400727 RepID=UPI000D729B60|nr:uncharacterized protein LOC112559819 [Pomacea canaliculata]
MLTTLFIVSLCSLTSGSPVSSSSQEVGRGTRGTAPPPFAFNLDLQGHYNLTQGHKLWLAGAPVFVHTDGHNYTTENGSLSLVHTQHHQGRDKVGQWVSTCFLYLAGSRHFQTCAKSWTNPQLPVVIFQQRFVNGTAKSSTGSVEGVISGFPSFKVPQNDSGLAYLSYQGGMFGSHTRTGRWDMQHLSLSGGIMGGPLAVF